MFYGDFVFLCKVNVLVKQVVIDYVVIGIIIEDDCGVCVNVCIVLM